LSVISRSLADVQPVFDTIAANALKLCDATFSLVFEYDGEFLKLASMHNMSGVEGVDALRRAFPRRLSRGSATDRAILSGATAYTPDVHYDPGYRHDPSANDGLS